MAVVLAGVAEGVWADYAEVADLWRKDREWEPGEDRSDVDARHQQWRRAVERSRAWGIDRSRAEQAP